MSLNETDVGGSCYPAANLRHFPVYLWTSVRPLRVIFMFDQSISINTGVFLPVSESFFLERQDSLLVVVFDGKRSC